MRAYVGQTRSRRLIAELSALGYGEMTQPSEYPPRRTPWALDNAAFKAWKSGKPFDGARLLGALYAEHATPPDFVVVPDLVAGGLASLALSRAWAPILKPAGVPLALVVQDGMMPADVRTDLETWAAVLFVGGTLPWKLRTAARWAALARHVGVPIHVGRVGTAGRVAAMKALGVDSIDSCLPLWSADNLRIFRGATHAHGVPILPLAFAEPAI